MLIIGGFWASLGPRLTVDNIYIGIYLPYALVLKFFPPLMSIRVTERWAFFVFVGLAYFAVLGISKIKKKWQWMAVAIVSVLYLIEMMPLSMPVETKNYYPPVYALISPICQEKPEVLLEFPFEQDIGYDANILTNLTYRTQYILASVKHKCLLVNGYSGYFPDDFIRYQNEMDTSVASADRERFFNLLRQRNVRLFKLNKKQIYGQKAKLIQSWLLHEMGVRILSNGEEYLLVRL